MRVHPPFLYYGPNSEEGLGSPYYGFDPKAVNRSNLCSAIPQPDPTDLFNQHSDSYVFLPRNKIKAYPMSSSARRNVNFIRKGLLFLRCCELVCSCILFIVSIIANPIQKSTTWVIRLAPVIAMIHSTYALYYLSCKKTARAKVFSKYCSIFASSDAMTIPFYIFMALFFLSRPIDTQSMDINELHINFTLSYKIGFYTAAIGASLYLASCAISLYLGRIFCKISKLPPDMNPMEENLTSRHKRNKSSIATNSIISEKPKSMVPIPKQISEASAETLNCQPTIPFPETENKPGILYNNFAPCSHDARQNLPSRRSQTPFSNQYSKSLKRSSCYKSFPKRPSYAEITEPNGDYCLNGESHTKSHSQFQSDKWHNIDALVKKHRNIRSTTLKKPKSYYEPLEQRHEPSYEHPNPLQANPLYASPLSPSLKKKSSHVQEIDCPNDDEPFSYIGTDSADIGDASLDSKAREVDLNSLKLSPRYGNLGPDKSPVSVGRIGIRQVSSGNDYMLGNWNSRGKYGRLEENGKVPEEDRDICRPSFARPRKFSGKLLF